MVADFDRFSWETARPETVEIVEDWWTPVSEDAPEGTDEYFTLGEPQDVFGLAAYMVGGGVIPAFRCTNAQYDLDSGEMIACDMVIEASPAVGKSVALLLRSFDMPSFALYSGDSYLRIVIPFKVLKASTDFEPLLQRLPEVASSDAIGTLENIDSFMPPDAGEKAARFFNELIL